MSLLLDSALDAERRRQAEAADAAEAAALATATQAVSARQRAEALKHYEAVKAIGEPTREQAREMYVNATRRAPVTQTIGDVFYLGMLKERSRILRALGGE